MHRKIYKEVVIDSAQLLGYAEFRPGQLSVVSRDVIAIPKESVFWVASLYTFYYTFYLSF